MRRLLFLIWVSYAQAIDLQCILFQKCPSNNNNNGQARSDRGEDPVFVDGQWIESSSLKNNQLYLFANDVGSKNWWDAETYCEEQGGYLAEPLSEAESNFLRDQAFRQPQANWWIGKSVAYFVAN